MSRLTVVFFSMQPGATLESFDYEQFTNEVTLPIRGLLASPSIADRILIVTLSSVKYERGEIFVRPPAFKDGPPSHLFSPTSDAVVKRLRGPIREGKLAFLNLEHLEEMPAVEYVVNHAFASGAEQVMVFRHGTRLPPRGLLRILYEKMLMDRRRSFVCQKPEQDLTPA